ncbi:MAG TPA: hypothetical protein VEX36_05225 [Thermoleophilaceae bacterium]|nr:hypothetical protein [Thermoleophilaceae bacterium]
MSVEAAQPLSPAEVFSRGFGLWWRTLGRMALGTIAVLVPLQVLSWLILFVTQPNYLETLRSYPELFEWYPKFFEWAEKSANNPNVPPPTLPEGLVTMPGSADSGLLLLGACLSIVISAVGISLLLSMSIEIAIGEVQGNRIEWRTALEHAVDRLRSVLFITVIWGVLLGVLAGVTFLVLSLPALWLTVAWAVPIPVFMYEGLKNFEALSRSFRLVRYRWWATFGSLALLWLIQFILIVILYAPIVAGLFLGWDLAITIALMVILGLLASIVAMPLLGTVLASIYLDLRLRKDGLGPGQITQPPPPSPEPSAEPSPPTPEQGA